MRHESIYQDEGPVELATVTDLRVLATDIAGLRSQLAALASVQVNTQFVLEAKAIDKRAKDLSGLYDRAINALTAAEQKQAEAERRVAEIDAREAAVKKAEDEIADERIKLMNEIKAEKESLQPRRDALLASEHRIRLFILRLLGRDHALQDVTSLDVLENELFGRPADVGADADSAGLEVEPVVLVGGSTLTRSQPKEKSRSLRRVQADT
jgi:hypothetical protein